MKRTKSREGETYVALTNECYGDIKERELFEIYTERTGRKERRK